MNIKKFAFGDHPWMVLQIWQISKTRPPCRTLWGATSPHHPSRDNRHGLFHYSYTKESRCWSSECSECSRWTHPYSQDTTGHIGHMTLKTREGSPLRQAVSNTSWRLWSGYFLSGTIDVRYVTVKNTSIFC